MLQRLLPAPTLFLVLTLISPTPAQGQVDKIFQILQDGGTWLNLQIEDGRHTYESPVMPLLGLNVEGCFRVWHKHSGTWHAQVADSFGDTLEVTVEPDEPVEFSFNANMRSQINVEITWSEPRDTTFYAWVGLTPKGVTPDRDLCEPPNR